MLTCTTSNLMFFEGIKVNKTSKFYSDDDQKNLLSI